MCGVYKGGFPLSLSILMIFCFAYQHVLFTFFGIIIRCGEIIDLDFHVLSFIFILFLTVNLAR